MSTRQSVPSRRDVCPRREEHACRLTVTLTDGRILVREMSEYEGFHGRPMSWEVTTRKFNAVAGGRGFRAQLGSVVKAVRNLEKISVRNLVMHLVWKREGPA